MVEPTLPHFEAVFQELDLQIRDLEVFIYHTCRLLEDLRANCQMHLEEIKKLSHNNLH